MKFIKIRAVFLILSLIFSIFIFIPMKVMKADGGSIDVVINEIMHDPLGIEVDEEYIELYNNGSTTVNLENWTLTDQDGPGYDFTFPNIDFPPMTYMILHTGEGLNDTDFSDGVAHFYLWKTSGIWGPYEDDVLLKNDTGIGIDYVAYGDEGLVDPPPADLTWSGSNPSAVEGDSISLHPNGYDSDSGLSWERSDPTPGRTNAHLYDDPPEIMEVRHTPLNPTTSEGVTIITNVSDDYYLETVTLMYNVDGSGYTSLPMIFESMNYSVQLPAQTEGTIVEYYILAIDDAQQNSTTQVHSFAHSDLPISVVINEFLPDPESDWNCDGYFDSDDEWIELYNPGDLVVNIGGWKIDDALGSVGSSDPFTIPQGISIGPREFLVFYGNDTGILLNNNGDNVTLLNETDTIIDVHTYYTSKDDTTCGRFPDGTDEIKGFLLPTPGYQNQYTVDSLQNVSYIKINEFLPTPKTVFSNEWIELYNAGTTPVRLDGLWLDDILDSGTKPWQIPLSTTIQPQHVILFNRSFGLNNAGDTVNLLYVDGTTVIDSYCYDTSEYDISFGRSSDGEESWISFSHPTPNQLNTPFEEPSFQERSIIIIELFYRSTEEEFLCLFNPSETHVNIGGWRISDGQGSYSGTIIFPEGTIMDSKDHIYVASSAVIFYNIMNFYPDFEYGNSSDAVPEMIKREIPSFSVSKDEALLLDVFGNLIDIVVYGDSEYKDIGWTGSPINDAKKGEILKRNYDEINKDYLDTNSSLDWEHIRHYKPGQTDFEYETFTYNGKMTLFSSPDSSYDTVVCEIEGAQNTIYISLYQFTNWNISEKIIEKLNANVDVKILMEGGPADGIAQEQKYILSKIVENGGDVRFMVTNSTLGARYRYVHAKYAIIDDKKVIISSENWKYTGLPVDNTYGNRGWGVVIENTDVAGYFTDVFLADWSSVGYDILPFTPDDPTYGNPSSNFELDDWIEYGYYDPIFTNVTLEGEFTVSPVISPDTSLLENEAILGAIKSAEESIYIEQLDCHLNWNEDEFEYENLFLTAAIEAAEERHVDVRILLSSKYAFSDDTDLDNYDTYDYINKYAQNHNITDYLEARLVDYDTLGLSKVHNKGMIVDGKYTLISSINWNRNSVTQNREVGVIIESDEVADYFTQIFLWDWNEPPLAKIEVNTTARASEVVQFRDLSFDSDDNIISYFWVFGDGTNSTEPNPTHIYKKEGVYDVVLIVSDGQYSDSYTITVVVGKAEEDDTGVNAIIYIVLLIIFIIIIAIIIVFIRRMRELFI
ncbi:MAG: lamin tail domain-containing protein [Thermoplasmata archaeon]|nr:MAG: lamin tail domain-containing protein [Thermoplasmata archaeon]